MTRDKMVDYLPFSGHDHFGQSDVEEAKRVYIATHPRGSENPSIVVVTGKPEDYTDEEIEKLFKFAKQKTAEWITNASGRPPIMIVIGKVSPRSTGSWVRKRVTWTGGNFFSPTLDEAIQRMASA